MEDMKGMNKKSYIYSLMAALLMVFAAPFSLVAQTDAAKHETVKVYFRQGSKNIDPNYMNNGEALNQLASLLEPYVLDGTKGKGRIQIMSSASPEGSANTNNTLVEQRNRAITDWMSKRFNVELGYELSILGIDWDTLLTLVESTPGVPSKEEVLNILRNTPADQRQYQLEQLHNGTPYQWILTRLYPKLRYAAVRTQIWYASEITLTSPNPMNYKAEGGNGTITFQKNVEDMVVPTVTCDAPWITDIVANGHEITYRVAPNAVTESRSADIRIECYGKHYTVTVNQEAAEPAPVPEPEPEPVVEEPVVEEPACKHDLFMSISNNGLYDLLLIPNIGAEIYLGKDWSLDANWHYSWWKTDKRHRYWRTYGGDITVRRWFGKEALIKPLTGHHVGLYGQMITYDFEFGGKGYLADRWSWAVGAEYGYSLPIARRLNLDFSIGIGYHWGKYDEYVPIDNHYVWQATKNRKFFGPTKAEVSIVWLLGCDNYNKQKGGKK